MHFLEIYSRHSLHNVVVTREMKLFHNHFSLRRHPSETILFQRAETCLKLFQNDLAGSRIFSTMFIVAEIILKQFILELLQQLK